MQKYAQGCVCWGQRYKWCSRRSIFSMPGWLAVGDRLHAHDVRSNRNQFEKPCLSFFSDIKSSIPEMCQKRELFQAFGCASFLCREHATTASDISQETSVERVMMGIFDDSILLQVPERRIVPMADVFLCPMRYTFDGAGSAFLQQTSRTSSFPGGIHAHRTLLHYTCCHAQLCTRGSFGPPSCFAPRWLGTLAKRAASSP